MRLLTDNEQAKELIELWRSKMPSNFAMASISSKSAELVAYISSIAAKIDELDMSTCTLQEVSSIVNYKPTSCTNCGAVGDLVQIGDPGDRDQLGALLCMKCCGKALSLFNKPLDCT